MLLLVLCLKPLKLLFWSSFRYYLKILGLEEVNNELILRQDVRQAQLKLSLVCDNLLFLIHSTYVALLHL